MSFKEKTLGQTLPWILIIGGGLGLLSAFILTAEKFAILENPSHQLSCSLNPILSCGPIMLSDQASAFGFPNPLIGLMSFSVLITIGMALLAGARFNRWFWRGLTVGSLLGLIFVHWLIFQSLYNIGALCLYCIVVWIVTWPIFWYTTLYNLRKRNLPTPKALRGVVAWAQQNHGNILIAWYVLIIAAIVQAFWYYWSTLI